MKTKALGVVSTLLLVCCAGKAVLAQDPNVTRERVICPGVETDERVRSNYPFTSSMPIELVVTGTATSVKSQGARIDNYDLAVQSVIYGGDPGKVVRFMYPWEPDNGPQIFAARAGGGRLRNEIRASAADGEVKSQTALAEARLDYHALAAESVFVGREVAAQGGKMAGVEVEGLLTPGGPAKGERVTVKISGWMDSTTLAAQLEFN